VKRKTPAAETRGGRSPKVVRRSGAEVRAPTDTRGRTSST
jgi:hypothetical protein